MPRWMHHPCKDVLLINGSAGPIVSVSALHAEKSKLEGLGIDVTTHIFTGWDTALTRLA